MIFIYKIDSKSILNLTILTFFLKLICFLNKFYVKFELQLTLNTDLPIQDNYF